MLLRFALPVLAVLGAAPAWAADASFVVSDNDGYGIADCMRPGMDCGRVIADAWCEAHGHGHASAFGLADDITGSVGIQPVAATPVPADSVVIRCGE